MPVFSEFLIWILPSAASLFIATGYIIEVSFQEFLGVSVDLEETAYLLATVKFSLDVLQALYEFIVRHGVFGTIGFLGLFSIGLCHFFMRGFRVRVNKILEWRYAILMLGIFFFGLFFWQIIFFLMPATKIDNILVSRTSFDRSFYSNIADDVWKDIYCSKVKHEQCSDSQTNHKPQDQRNRLQDFFVQNFVLWLLISLSGFLVIPRLFGITPIPLLWKLVPRLCAFLMVVSVIVSYISLPYTYAKLIRSTEFREAIIHYKYIKGQIPLTSLGSSARETTREKKKESETNVSYRPVSGFILANNQQALTIFSKDDDRVWHIPRSILRLVKLTGHADVLAFHFQGSQEALRREGPPSPS